MNTCILFVKPAMFLFLHSGSIRYCRSREPLYTTLYIIWGFFFHIDLLRYRYPPPPPMTLPLTGAPGAAEKKPLKALIPPRPPCMVYYSGGGGLIGRHLSLSAAPRGICRLLADNVLQGRGRQGRGRQGEGTAGEGTAGEGTAGEGTCGKNDGSL